MCAIAADFFMDTGGVGTTPARACFCGVRSLSLVLSDFGTLLFSLFLSLILLILSFLFCYNHLTFGSYQDSCQGFESS